MKGMSKSNKKHEPTIADVLDAVQTGFSRHEDILTELQTGFARHKDVLIELQTGSERHERILTTLHEGQQNLSEQLKNAGRRLANTQNRNVTRTGVKEKFSILDHERRIRHLEKTRS
ncbi:MAG: hypothetical protein NT108_02995 [Candidatus Kaiserbacteria bacterium]|nr:hypothetical protein [Candidatus Kaiserbacteria bacterium]